MYRYLPSSDGKFSVGFFKPDGDWAEESKFSDREAAAERVNYLNGSIVGNVSNKQPMIQPSDN